MSFFYDWGGLNTQLFYLINGIQGEAFRQFMQLGTMLGKFTLFPVYFAIIAGIGFYDVSRNTLAPIRRKQWTHAIIVLIAAYLFSLLWVYLLKTWLHFPRPFVALPEGTVHILDYIRASEEPMVSFPSGHSVFTTLMVASLWPMLNKTAKIIGIAFVLWVGVSRIALGVHFPADVVYSMALSFTAVCIVKLVINRIYPQLATTVTQARRR